MIQERVEILQNFILYRHYNTKSAFMSYYVYVGKKRFGFTGEMGHIFKED